MWEPETCLRSRVLGQVLLPHVKGDPFRYKGGWGTRDTLCGPMFAKGCTLVCWALMYVCMCPEGVC